MRQVNVHEAKSQLSRLIEAALAGEEIVIARSGKPAVMLTPIQPEKKKIVFGILKDQDAPSEDFDTPLSEDILEGLDQ
jgi:prevent-host-death family protein